jgi:alkylation response protein AidB-like acyl-CoA dehydrogenase
MMDGAIINKDISPPRTDILAAIAAHAARHDRDGSFPFESFELLHEERLLGLTARVEDGGSDAGLEEVGLIIGEVGRACPSTALVLSMQFTHIKNASRNPNWPEHLKARLGRSAAGCGALVNALRVEPALGTPARGGLPETTARRTADGWSITGRKIYSTGAPALRWMLVWARTDEDEPRTGMFLVPAQSDGVSIVETWDHLGLRASGSHDVLLNDVEVPAEYAVDIRAPAAWAQRETHQAAWNAVTIGSLYTGIAQAARDWLVGFLRERAPSNLGAPLATLPRMQEEVGAIEALLTTNRRLICSVAREYDGGVESSSAEYGLVKTVVAENAIQAVERAIKLTGNHGLARANPIERHLRDVLCSRIHTPQPDAAHIAAGRAALL